MNDHPAAPGLVGARESVRSFLLVGAVVALVAESDIGLSQAIQAVARRAGELPGTGPRSSTQSGIAARALKP